MNSRKEESTSSYSFFFPSGNNDNEAAKRGLLVGAGFGAGQAIRGGLFRTLCTSALLIPSLATLGMFANVEYTRRHGRQKQDELINSALENALAAKGIIAEKIKTFTK